MPKQIGNPFFTLTQHMGFKVEKTGKNTIFVVLHNI